ncbi:RNA 2',3'-cyclic phosphodiesterase [Alkalihalobacterium sp. APHAB7]|uniref:RNA 2',3'-cyclic phosphodiesterase n=1 Tax=Alkalihalobacterium sp. APHAB7 TaxID=3402081 RepID=UPI003AABE742
MKTHFFLAIPVVGIANQSLINWQEQNKNYFLFKKWVHPQDLHITLVFLGHVEDGLLQCLGDQLELVAKQQSSFTLNINGLDTFGEKKRPRIFWAGVDKEEQLIELQSNVAKTCARLGLEIENRPYRPHITLARRWNGDDIYSPDKANQSFTKNDLSSWKVDKFHLYQSHIGKSPMYEPLRTFSFSADA